MKKKRLNKKIDLSGKKKLKQKKNVDEKKRNL